MPNRKRVAVKLVTQQDYPATHQKKKDWLVAVTQDFATAFSLTAEAQTLDPIQKGGKWRVPGLAGYKSRSYRFWKLVQGEKKAFSAPCGAPLYAVLKAARRLNGCIGVTSPLGVSYWFTTSGSSSGTGG